MTSAAKTHLEPERMEAVDDFGGLERVIAVRGAALESAHRCACGEPLYREGSCASCEAQRDLDRRRREYVSGFQRSLPAQYRGSRFERAELASRVRDATGIARAIATCNPKTVRVVLLGPAGAGKTSLAVAIATRMCSLRNTLGVFTDARDLAMSRRDHRLGAEPALVTRALRAGVLVLDDLGVDPVLQGSAVVDVIRDRHAHERLTIITTSLTPTRAGEIYGDGVARRIFEHAAGVHVIELHPSRGAP